MIDDDMRSSLHPHSSHPWLSRLFGRRYQKSQASKVYPTSWHKQTHEIESRRTDTAVPLRQLLPHVRRRMPASVVRHMTKAYNVCLVICSFQWRVDVGGATVAASAIVRLMSLARPVAPITRTLSSCITVGELPLTGETSFQVQLRQRVSGMTNLPISAHMCITKYVSRAPMNCDHCRTQHSLSNDKKITFQQRSTHGDGKRSLEKCKIYRNVYEQAVKRNKCLTETEVNFP